MGKGAPERVGHLPVTLCKDQSLDLTRRQSGSPEQAPPWVSLCESLPCCCNNPDAAQLIHMGVLGAVWLTPTTVVEFQRSRIARLFSFEKEDEGVGLE